MPQAGAFLDLQGKKSVKTIFLQGLLASSVPLFFSGLHHRWTKRTQDVPPVVLFVTNDADSAGYFYHDLTQVMGNDQVMFFPSGYRRQVKYGQRDAANDILRTEVLTSLSTDATLQKPLFIVSHPEALAELVISQQKLNERTMRLTVGESYDIMKVVSTLREYGFQETDYVYEPGQFAVRGSILDVYSFSCEQPFRIDFFGDEIDTIRVFEVENQLSSQQRTSVELVPDISARTEKKISFMELLPEGSLLVVRDYTFLCDRIAQIYQEGFSQQALTERMEGKTEVEQQQIAMQMQRESQIVSSTRFAGDAARLRRIEIGSKPTGSPDATITFKISPQPLFHKNFDMLTRSLDDYLLQGYKLYILADSAKQQQRLRDIFDERGEKSDMPTDTRLQFTPIDHTIHEGFVDHQLKACLFTDHQIFDRFHKFNLKSDKARSGKMALTLKELQEMEPGDFIVHVDFGIGKFAGLVRVPLPARQGTTNGNAGYQEMIRLVYQRGDIVDVSIHSLYKISKYRSNDGEKEPRLSTLGTGAWERMKERTKKRIKDIARDLIQLYARRKKEKGFAYSPDTYLQHELEASFLYEDTPDQQKATAEVKLDMESQRPMDRLVCGDVGFGKTEVAVRAAFKAACDSKQVAVMVPTTVLAFQHFQTFRDRLRHLPVRVDYLSRARTAKQTRQVMEDLKAGRIDILIGTQKMIGKSVEWKDLGLLIIDEEQKFGVSTKEKLRQMKTNVDTLTMSATPIPRTLQFSLMGARDMSIMRTPPPNRYPIHTELASFGGEVIADAINFEMSRNGQVFFVNDNIRGLDHIASVIKKYVPDCRIAIGHGQMKPEQLEEIIMGFINHDYDVLLSTTIVENGVDIPNANTIIINDAHRFGLSDLHQMRGRVGRSNRKAFCYLLSPPLSALSNDARRRLEALESFSELGSGFNLAMQDLDIRGAGNLLGAEQSGFMEDLGYETYLKILKEAMAELRNEAPIPHPTTEGEHEAKPYVPMPHDGGMEDEASIYVADCALESDLEMYFPDNYVPGSSERMLLYRELDNIESDQELEAYRKRLEDRFGKIPREGQELMQVVTLRRIGKNLGCEKIILRSGKMQMQFVSNVDSPFYRSSVFGKIINFAAANPRLCLLKENHGKRFLAVNDIATVGKAVDVMRKME